MSCARRAGSPHGGIVSAGRGSDGCDAHQPCRKSRPSRTVTGQGVLLCTLAQTRIAAGIARNIPLPCSRRLRPTSSAVPQERILPCSMTATLPASGKASSSRCSVRRMVVPNSRLILPRTARKSDAAIGSSWLVGSSRISTFGCMTITAARFRSCFCPPESEATSR